MAKIKDIAGGFYDNDTIYSPIGFTQARKVSDAIVDRNISDMQNEIQQGVNIGAEARKNKREDDKASIAELTGNKKVAKKVVKGKVLPKPSEQKTVIKKETLVNPDSVQSGATAEVPAELKNVTPGSKVDPTAVRGRRADEPAPTPNLPQARPNLREDLADAVQTLQNKREERDDYARYAKQNTKAAKLANRDLSIILDDIDFEDEFDGTDPVVASFFKKGKINKILKEQIKDQYSEQVAEIAERIKNDPANKDLSGREVQKLINKEVKAFIEPKWEDAGGNEKVYSMRLLGPFVAGIKKIVNGENVSESTKRLHTETRDRLRNKQNKSVRDKLYLAAWDKAETRKANEEKAVELKGGVKKAREHLTEVNAEVRDYEKAVEKAINEFNKGEAEVKVTHKGGWTFFDKGNAHYAAHVEIKDGKKKYVTYSVTGGSPDTDLDPIWEYDYVEYSGTKNYNEQKVKNDMFGTSGQIVGGRTGQMVAMKEASDKQTFETLDNQNYFEYIKAHKGIAPKILKLIKDRGGKVDSSTGKICTVSAAGFPEGADELHVDYGTALKLAKGDDEEVAKLTGMSLREVKDRRVAGMERKYKIGDARVIQDDQGRAVYQLPDSNISAYSGKHGSFYINWNNPKNRKVVEKYVKMGMTKQDIPLSELETVNTSRSTEGNIDWTDKEKTSAAERDQMAKYTGSFKPGKDILDALIGFGNKNKPL